MTKLESIVVSNTEPNSKNVLWYDNKRLLIFSNGHWSPIVDLDDIDVDNLPGVSNLQEALKSLNIKVDNKVDKVEGKGLSTNDYTDNEKSKLSTLPTSIEIDAALTDKQDKIVDSADIKVGWDDGIEGRTLYIEHSAKQKVFDDLWISAAGSNGTVDHTHTESGVSKPYYLNEVWMTYEEALVVYNEYYADILSLQSRDIYGVTNFPPPNCGAAMQYTNYTASNAKVINVGGGFFVESFLGWLSTAPKLTKIIGTIDLTYWSASVKSSRYLIAPALTDVSFYHLHNNFDISSLKSISLSSMQYMVNNPTATSPITVTAHPDVYAKLTGDTTNAAAAALTSDELAQWTALAITANSKNISFATPE